MNTTARLAALAATWPHRLHAELTTRREQGAIGVEYVVLAVGLFAIITGIVTAIAVWVNGKLAGLT